ncbi:hypothetical protein EYF80_062922 [Liparis tanakae]|uniref:Uncharacterized protein n=1 Tax=Liparis tanakae TaxID=230148 RepID=A0A4Z2EDH7_9TELE|nr:hypothetical protein EYF80_062922 [Liparis tanakae]
MAREQVHCGKEDFSCSSWRTPLPSHSGPRGADKGGRRHRPEPFAQTHCVEQPKETHCAEQPKEAERRELRRLCLRREAAARRLHVSSLGQEGDITGRRHHMKETSSMKETSHEGDIIHEGDIT